MGALAEACKQVASEPVAFNTQWRAKQLEYSFPRADMSAGVGISTLVSNAQFFYPYLKMCALQKSSRFSKESATN